MSRGGGRWTGPGGHIEPGETAEEAVRRELAEEAGIEVTVTGLTGVYSKRDPAVVFVSYRGATDGEPVAGEETDEVRWFAPHEVPWGELMLRGPLLARVEKEGLTIRADESTGVLLKETIGDLSFQPLTVHEIRPTDTLLAGWQACRAKKKEPRENGAQVERVIVDLEGNAVHTLPPVPLKLEGGKVMCHRGLDKIEPGTLEPGEYTVEVAVTQGGKRILEKSTPLLVD